MIKKPFLGLELGEEEHVEDSLFLAGVSLICSFLTYPALKTLKVTIDPAGKEASQNHEEIAPFILSNIDQCWVTPVSSCRSLVLGMGDGSMTTLTIGRSSLHWQGYTHT